jgi:hypothetical protein
MAIFSEKQIGTFWGFSLGIAAVMISRKLFPAMKDAGRPITKAAIKSGIAAYGKMRLAAAQFGETVEDIVAEAVMESEEQHKRRSPEQPRPATEQESEVTSSVGS